ncbi:MAG: hypothetical protein ACRDQA_13210 [Nocardioidaceae bacterium]
MQIRRGRPDRFTQVPNTTVDDLGLDILALGLLTQLLRFPDGWSTDLDQIGRRRGPSRRQLYPAMRTLVEAGYVIKIKYQQETGKWATDVYTFDTPAEPDEVADLLTLYQGARAIRVEPARFAPAPLPMQEAAPTARRCVVGADLGKRTEERTNPQVTPTTRNRQVGNRQVGGRAAPKKTDKKTGPPPRPPSTIPPEEEGNPPEPTAADKVLDTAVDAWRPHIGPRGRARLAPKVTAALAVGHRLDNLVNVLNTNRDGVRNPVAVLCARLDDLGEPNNSQPPLPELCGRCDNRWINHLDGTVSHCPTCNPAARPKDGAPSTRSTSLRPPFHASRAPSGRHT